jgi:uncharacterized protein YacL
VDSPTTVDVLKTSKSNDLVKRYSVTLLLLRIVFVMVVVGIATAVSRKMTEEPWWANDSGPAIFLSPNSVGALIYLLAFAIIIGDILSVKRRIETVSAIYIGLLVGILLTYALNTALTPITQDFNYKSELTLFLGATLCYLCISRLLQTKDDFRFIIPYVEFARDLKGIRPLLLDTSSIIDGRLADLADTSIIDNQLIMPRFVLNELQAIADSSDRIRRVKGRRGLDILNRLRNHERIDFELYDRELPEFAGQSVDMKLVLLAKQLEAKIVTGDFNLNKVAKLHNVDVINLNEVANSLRPQFLPGETFQIRIVKPGEGQDQGVGYLDDGTMVVIEGGRARIGETVIVVVTGTLQTNAGRMIFTRIDDGNRSDTHE